MKPNSGRLARRAVYIFLTLVTVSLGSDWASSKVTFSSFAEALRDACLSFLHKGAASRGGMAVVLSPYEAARERVRSGETDSYTAYSTPDDKGRPVWMAERAKTHAELLVRFEAEVEAVSRVLNQSPLGAASNQPILVLTRGNSGAGKTTALKLAESPLLKNLALPEVAKGHSDGIINPDTIKTEIQNQIESGLASTAAVHEEGSYLAKLLIEKTFAQKSSLIIDKRFGTLDSVEKVTRQAKALGYRIVMIDVDSPLEVSTERILKRVEGGGSPNVPFQAVKTGFEESRAHRRPIAELADIDDYLSISDGKIIASKTQGQPLVVQDPARWTELTTVKLEQKELTTEAIYAELLNAKSEVLPAEYLRPFVREADEDDELVFHRLPRDLIRRPGKTVELIELGLKIRLKDYRYEAQKDAGQRYHELLADTIQDYLEHYSPDCKITRKIVPETENKMASVVLRIQGIDYHTRDRLLSDGNWPFHLDPRSNAQSPDLIFDTYEVAKIAWEQQAVPKDDRGPGRNPRTYESAGSLGHEFVKTANDQGRKIGAPPLIFMKTHGTQIHFLRYADRARFRYGFRVDEAQAYGFGAKVELVLAKEAKRAGNYTEAAVHLKFADENVLAAMQFAGIVNYSLDGNAALELVDATPAQREELRRWFEKEDAEFQLLLRQVAELKRVVAPDPGE